MRFPHARAQWHWNGVVLLALLQVHLCAGAWQCHPSQCVNPGQVSTVAGEDDDGMQDGVGSLASFYNPKGLSFFPDGNRLVVCEEGNDLLRVVDISTGSVSTLAGTKGCTGTGGNDDPCFRNPFDVAVSPDGLFVAVSDTTNARIRLVNGTGYTTILSGSGYSATPIDGIGTNAKWEKPGNIAFSPDGRFVAVTDESAASIRVVNVASGETTTILGDHLNLEYEEGTGTRAQFDSPKGLAYSPDGAKLAIIDSSVDVVRIADLANMTTTLLAGDPLTSGRWVDGPFGTGRFHNPTGVAWSPDGNHLAVIDSYENLIRVVDAATGYARTLAGDGTTGLVDGVGTNAKFINPQGIAWGSDGTIAVTDYGSLGHYVRLLSPTCGSCPGAPAPDKEEPASVGTTTPEPEEGTNMMTYIYLVLVVLFFGGFGCLVWARKSILVLVSRCMEDRSKSKVAPVNSDTDGTHPSDTHTPSQEDQMEQGNAQIEVSAVPARKEEEEEEEEARMPPPVKQETKPFKEEENRSEAEGASGEEEEKDDDDDDEDEGSEVEADAEGGWGQDAAGAAVGSLGDAEPKFAARTLVLGQSEEAAAGLKSAIGLHVNQVFANLLKQGLEAIESEFFENGSDEDQDNFNYVVKGTACATDSLPKHVKEQIEKGWYHGGQLGVGEFDEGHDGWTLDDFVNHEHSRIAGLQVQHVVALRLYTTTSYRRFNAPMRARQKPHPFRMTVYFLDEGLRKLRQVGARLDPNGFSEVRYLWRGMHRMRLEETFLRLGGTELAPMSTTTDKHVALKYAGAESPLVFKYKTRGLGRGVSIRYLSVYPKEEEYLYPPLTFLQPEGKPKIVRGVTVVTVTPQMS